MRKRARTAALLLAVLVSLCVPIRAAGGASLTVVHQSGGTALAGARFSIYRVAAADADGFTLTADFAGSGVELDGLDASGLKAAAAALSAYAADGAAQASGTTGADGTVSFAELETGLYLVVGGALVSGNTSYQAAPFLVAVPGEDGEAVTAYTKVSNTTTPPGTTVDVTVLKVWNDNGSGRPASISVSLLRDGRAYDTVTLNSDSNWRHTWTGLDAQHSWSVREDDVPVGYHVSYSGSGARLVITNTLTPDNDGPEPPPETPPDDSPKDSPDTPTKEFPDGPTPLDSPDAPDGPPVGEIPDEPTPQGDKLPQTGLLWWPVPVLATAGVLLFSWGWWKHGREHEE